LREIELLIPAGSLEVLITAVDYGADAVYIGGEFLGLRAKAKNFSLDEMKKGLEYAHEKGKKVFVTANITAHNMDLNEAREYFKELNKIKPDAVIISDPGLFMLAKEELEGIDLHISTQANNTNYATYNFWWNLGASRVVTARELSLEEIKGIRENIPEKMEIETFIHGSMCMAYSGRCLLSNFMTGRDANQGECTNPCRWKYSVVEEKRPGEYMPIYEDERGTYIFNSKDLCMIEHIPALIDAGIDSFKIEGRTKTSLYVATVARTYRKAIDDYLKSPKLYEENLEWYKNEIGKCTTRAFTTGFFFGKATSDSQIYDNNVYVTNYKYIGRVEKIDEKNKVLIEQKNKFSVGDEVELMDRRGINIPLKVNAMYDIDGNAIESAPHSRQMIWIDLGDTKFTKGDILRAKAT
jgi:hypothetical protein